MSHKSIDYFRLTNWGYDVGNNVIFGTLLGEGFGETDLTQFGS
jgi:hypothetical protein